MREKIIKSVRDAGVIGAGGGGFPTHVKLAARADTFIANGAECEPIVSSDRVIMETRARDVLEGLRLAMKATGAERGVVALKEHYHDAIDAFEKNLKDFDGIEIFPMKNYYPAGDEFLMVYEVTGRVIPEHGIPLDVGVVVNNVTTLVHIYEAYLNNKPVTSKFVTVAGEVKEPKVVPVPVGMSYADVIALARGATIDEEDIALLDGGPMMGRVIFDTTTPIIKTTNSVIVLHKDHYSLEKKRMKTRAHERRSLAVCCQCMECSVVCPRHLIGHKLRPHLVMRAVNYGVEVPSWPILSALQCSACGLCEIACHQELSPKEICSAIKRELAGAGYKAEKGPAIEDVREAYHYRKIPLPRLVSRLGLRKYDVHIEGDELSRSNTPHPAKRVELLLGQHAGAPAKPVVHKGDKVKVGELVAEIQKGMLGANIHASINGQVVEVNQNSIVIEGGR